jgi:hypothetical protein
MIRSYPAPIDYVIDCAALSFIPSSLPEGEKDLRGLLIANQAPAWLERIDMPKGNPLLVWRVRPPGQ